MNQYVFHFTCTLGPKGDKMGTTVLNLYDELLDTGYYRIIKMYLLGLRVILVLDTSASIKCTWPMVNGLQYK
jgi:hypothetical protein